MKQNISSTTAAIIVVVVIVVAGLVGWKLFFGGKQSASDNMPANAKQIMATSGGHAGSAGHTMPGPPSTTGGAGR